MTIGDIIKEYRQKHNLSQRKFALIANITNSYVSALEMNSNPSTGKSIMPTIEVLNNIAGAMNISIDELIYRMGKDYQTAQFKNTLYRENDSEIIELLFAFNKLNKLGKETIIHLTRALTEKDEYTL